MRKLPIIAATLAFLPFVACNKPEVVPPPSEKATLNSHFIGTINGTQIEWTKNVNSYANYSSLEFYLDTNTNVHNYRYYGGMSSSIDPKMIRVGFGSFISDPNVQASPSIETFKSFLMTFADPNTAPDFAENAVGGFEIQYRDAAGDIFRTVDSSTTNSYLVKDLKYSEDVNGDYMSYTCEFSGVLYHTRKDTNNVDTINKIAIIQNAALKGWLKREN